MGTYESSYLAIEPVDNIYKCLLYLPGYEKIKSERIICHGFFFIF